MRISAILVITVLLVGCRPPPPQSSLFDAARLGSVAQIEMRLSEGVKVGQTDAIGATALHYAALRGHVPVVELLLRSGADPSARDESRRTPLHYAASMAQAAVMRRLVEAGVDVSLVDDHGMTAAHLATVSEVPPAQVIDALTALRDAKANLLARDHERRTPAYMAAVTGQVGVLEFLVESGATLRGPDAYGMTLLHAAARGAGIRRDVPHRAMVHYLLEHELEIDATDVQGRTPLLFAAQAGAADVAEMLISRGAKVDARDIQGMGALHYALSDKDAPLEERLRTLTVLLSLGADVDAKNDSGDTALHIAADIGDTASARLLVRQGAAVNAQTRDGMTPLHAAAKRGSAELVAFLLSEGADVDARTRLGSTPLNLAQRNNHPAVIKLLEATQSSGV
ncbi:MAG: ankyrin repeat domain-containing protein [Phycisphaerales bacterium]|nr:ankyrin repeat domain-containing protein [Phycisphaerales bacterium]